LQKIPLSLARPGMALARPVLRDNGMVLVAEGTELTESLLARLEGIGVASLVVQGEAVAAPGASGGLSWSDRAGRLDHLFRRHGQNSFMLQFKELVRRFMVAKAAAEGAEEPGEKKEDDAR
jgi:hypothetical protein